MIWISGAPDSLLTRFDADSASSCNYAPGLVRGVPLGETHNACIARDLVARRTSVTPSAEVSSRMWWLGSPSGDGSYWN